MATPAEALITAMAVAEHSGPLMPDLKRSEDLGPDLRRRLLRMALPLLPVPEPPVWPPMQKRWKRRPCC